MRPVSGVGLLLSRRPCVDAQGMDVRDHQLVHGSVDHPVSSQRRFPSKAFSHDADAKMPLTVLRSRVPCVMMAFIDDFEM